MGLLGGPSALNKAGIDSWLSGYTRCLAESMRKRNGRFKIFLPSSNHDANGSSDMLISPAPTGLCLCWSRLYSASLRCCGSRRRRQRSG